MFVIGMCVITAARLRNHQFSSKFLSALSQLAPALFCVAKPFAKWSNLWQRRCKLELLFARVITSNPFDTKVWGLNRDPWVCPFITGNLEDSLACSLYNFVSVSTEQQVMLLNGCVVPVESKQQPWVAGWLPERLELTDRHRRRQQRF